VEIHSITEFVKYFERVRDRTGAVVRRIPEDRLDWTPVEGHFTLGDLVRHFAATERWMFGENIQGRPSRYPGHGPELADGLDAVVVYFSEMHRQTMEIISDLTAEGLLGKSPTPGGVAISTWKWLRAMVEHEIHHRGQLYTLLGLIEVETPPLYGLTERQVFENSEPF